MPVDLQSTNAKIRDHEKVREIIDSYAVRYVEIQVKEESTGWVLAMEFLKREAEWNTLPEALHRDQWPSEKYLADEEENDEIYESWQDLFLDDGDKAWATSQPGTVPRNGTTDPNDKCS